MELLFLMNSLTYHGFIVLNELSLSLFLMTSLFPLSPI